MFERIEQLRRAWRISGERARFCNKMNPGGKRRMFGRFRIALRSYRRIRASKFLVLDAVDFKIPGKDYKLEGSLFEKLD